MENGFLILTEKDWEKASSDQKLWWVFNTMQSIDARLKVLERRTITDKVCSFVGGVVGGFGLWVLSKMGVKL